MRKNVNGKIEVPLSRWQVQFLVDHLATNMTVAQEESMSFEDYQEYAVMSGMFEEALMEYEK